MSLCTSIEYIMYQDYNKCFSFKTLNVLLFKTTFETDASSFKVRFNQTKKTLNTSQSVLFPINSMTIAFKKRLHKENFAAVENEWSLIWSKRTLGSAWFYFYFVRLYKILVPTLVVSLTLKKRTWKNPSEHIKKI